MVYHADAAEIDCCHGVLHQQRDVSRLALLQINK